MTLSKYSFYRTELRVLQNMCEGDNELFLNQLADTIGKRDEEIQNLKTQISDHRASCLAVWLVAVGLLRNLILIGVENEQRR